MAKPSKRKLKVFQAQIGFHETVVAAPSRAAALRAWGTHQDLFADGQARLTTDARATEAALAHPETPLLRPMGSAGPFEPDPVNPPLAPRARKLAKARTTLPPRPAVDRRALAASETALRRLEDAHRRDEAKSMHEAKELQVRRSNAQEAFERARKAAVTAVERARKAFEKAGGRD